MRGAECWREDRVFGDKKKLMKFEPTSRKRIEAYQIVCVEKFQQFQSGVLTIDLVGSPDPEDIDAK